MKEERFQIEIEETLSRIVEVQAENFLDALQKVEEMYKREEVVLSVNDFVAVDFP